MCIKRKWSAELEQCQQMAEKVQVEMEMVKFLAEQQFKKPEKLDAEAIGKLLGKLRQAAKILGECRECTSDIQDKLDFI